MRNWQAALLGAAATLAARPALRGVLGWRLRRDLAALNAGDYQPILANYAEDAVLRFPEGDHRFAGEHREKPAIERFFKEFIAAGLQGELRDLLVSGPPWRMTMVVRFDDHAVGPNGERLYANHAVLLIRAKWGRIVEHTDYFEDTERIGELERRLRELASQA